MSGEIKDPNREPPDLKYDSAKEIYKKLEESSPADLWANLLHSMEISDSDNAELKVNPHFDEINGLAPAKELYNQYVEKLQKINPDNNGQNLSGHTVDGVAVYLELGALLKTLDEADYKASFPLSYKKILRDQVKPLLELTQNEPKKFLEYAYYAKVLFPDDFEESLFINQKNANAIAHYINSQKKDWMWFAELYYKFAFLDKEQAKILCPLSAEDLKQISNKISSLKGKGLDYLEAAAWAQELQPQGLKPVRVNLQDWNSGKKQLELLFNKSKDFGKFLIRSQYLKYLKIEEDDAAMA